MNIKKNTKLYIPILLVLLFVLFVLNLYKSSNSYSLEIIDIVRDDKEHNLTYQELIDFEIQINKELSESKSQKYIKSNYYALGTIKYLLNDYSSSVNYLLKSLEYNLGNDPYIDFMIYTSLSSNYIQLDDFTKSEKYFNKAKSLALSNNMKENLCELYYSKAKALLISDGSIQDIVNLMDESLKYTKIDDHKIRNYIFLSSAYKLNGNFEMALKYTYDALKISIDSNNSELINSSIINLGETYYITRDYEKTIDIYNKLIDSKTLTNTVNKLTVYGYLLDSYARINDYTNFIKYKNMYLSLVETLDENSKTKELIWLYTTCSSAEINFSHIDLAQNYLSTVKQLYSKSNKNSYAYINFYMLFAELRINYYKNKNYDTTLYEYENLISKLDEIGIISDIKLDIVYEILKISYTNQDYATMINYINHNEHLLNYDNSKVQVDNAFAELNKLSFKKTIFHLKVGVICLLLSIAIFFYMIITLKRKNKEIILLNLKLDEYNKIDPLTNLYNKGYLNDVLSKVAHDSEFITFCMIDIDYFKRYNDGYGHIQGDDTLKMIATIINNVFINDDNLVFRYGGEEFSVVSKYNLTDFIKYLDILQTKVYEENILHEYSDVSDRVSLSIGVSTLKVSSDDDIYKIIKTADDNLYLSKNRGRNRYTY